MMKSRNRYFFRQNVCRTTECLTFEALFTSGNHRQTKVDSRKKLSSMCLSLVQGWCQTHRQSPQVQLAWQSQRPIQRINFFLYFAATCLTSSVLGSPNIFSSGPSTCQLPLQVQLKTFPQELLKELLLICNKSEIMWCRCEFVFLSECLLVASLGLLYCCMKDIGKQKNSLPTLL